MTDAGRSHLGFIGLGIMGAPMAENLLDAGYRLTVWNRTPSKAEPLVARGAAAADSPAAVAQAGPSVIFVNVTDTPDVEAVLLGERGVAEGARPGLIVVDHSTISPTATQALAERLAARGVTLVDAPVSGGDTGARAGTLSVMVGGPAEAVAAVRPMLEVVGGRVTHVGPVGMGQAAKACNQVAGLVTLLAVCESLALDPDRLLEAIGGGAAGSWQLENLGPKVRDGDHDPGFMVDLALKDLGIVAQTGRELKLPLLGTAVAERLLQAVSAGGGGRLGTQAMARAIEALGGFRFDDAAETPGDA